MFYFLLFVDFECTNIYVFAALFLSYISVLSLYNTTTFEHLLITNFVFVFYSLVLVLFFTDGILEN